MIFSTQVRTGVHLTASSRLRQEFHSKQTAGEEGSPFNSSGYRVVCQSSALVICFAKHLLLRIFSPTQKQQLLPQPLQLPTWQQTWIQHLRQKRPSTHGAHGCRFQKLQHLLLSCKGGAQASLFFTCQVFAFILLRVFISQPNVNIHCCYYSLINYLTLWGWGRVGWSFHHSCLSSLSSSIFSLWNQLLDLGLTIVLAHLGECDLPEQIKVVATELFRERKWWEVWD